MNTPTSATTQLDDPVFGEMKYKHSWYRMQSINWWGRESLDLKITAHAYAGKGITDQQRTAFSEYQQEIDNVISKYISTISDTLQSSFNANYSEEDIFSKLVPRTVLFFENGDWGILFDAEIDIEHGVALYKKNGTWKVGSQDDFL